MRVLFLIAQVPYPPHAGSTLRNFGLINGLHQAGHHIDLICFTEPEAPDPRGTALSQICDEIITVPLPPRTLSARLRDLALTSHPDMIRRYESPAFADAVRTQLAYTKYDLVQIEELAMASYLPLFDGIRVIYDAHNAEYDLQRFMFQIDRRDPARLVAALYSLIQWRRLARFERQVCQKVDHVIAVSEADADALRHLVSGLKVSVVPNAIDVGDYTAPMAPQLELGKAALLFTGTMNYRPNIDAVMWFVNQVLPDIRAAVPEARLFVVGNKPNDKISALRGRDDVEVTGYVQEMLPFLGGAAVYVAPLRMGSGTRLKLLQAMAAGCAIVSTSVGAAGITPNGGLELAIADDAETFARSVIALLQNPAKRAQMGAAARELVCKKYDWSVIVPKLLNVYREIGLG